MTAQTTTSQPAPAGEVVIDLAGLRKWYEGEAGRVLALDGIDLRVRAGEFVCLVGPSGCGKTTLLRLLGGLEEPGEGRLALYAGDDDRLAQATVFQGQALLPWRRIRDNIAYGLELRGVSTPERAAVADRLMARVGLEQFAAAFPHELSEGMRQRANIARALAVDPAVLLMDEPFANLDEQNRLLLQEDLMRLWAASGKTVVFVTHSLDEAMLLADRIVVLSARPGRVVANIPVPFARPRSLLAIKAAPEYGPLTARLWGLLRQEVTENVKRET
jgi:NitT/TauT family transport system ATP-binding protein